MKRPGGFDRGDAPRSHETARTAPTVPTVPSSSGAMGVSGSLGVREAGQTESPRDPGHPPTVRDTERSMLTEPEAPDQGTSNHIEAGLIRESGAEGGASLLSLLLRPSKAAGEVDRDPVRAAGRRLRSAERSRRAQERRDQRRFTAHVRKRRRVWMVAGGAVIALALFVAVGVFTPIMAVREVQVAGASRINAEELVGALARFEGVPLALVDEQDVHRALEPFPLIQRYAIERIPPHTLIVRIEERDPVLALERDGQFVLVDPAGVLVATSAERPEGVPVGSGTVIDTASPAFSAAAAVIRDMPADLRVLFSAVTASSGQDIEFSLTSGTRVMWGDDADTQRKAVVLRAMLASIGAASVIDVASPESPVFQ